MADPLESLLIAIGSAHNAADSVDTRRSQRVTARKREMESIEQALSSPKVFRARGEDASVSSFAGMKRSNRKSNMTGAKVDRRFEVLMEQVDPWIGGASASKSASQEGDTFPSLSRVTTPSELLQALAANGGPTSTPYTIPAAMGYPMLAMTGIINGAQTQEAHAAPFAFVPPTGPAPPSLRNLILPQELSAAATNPLQAPFIYPYFFSTGMMGNAAPFMVPQFAFSPIHSQPATNPSVGPVGPSATFPAPLKPSLLSGSSFGPSPTTFASHTTQPASPQRDSSQPTQDAAFTIIGRAPKRISENTQINGAFSPEKRRTSLSGAITLPSLMSEGADPPPILRPDSPCSSHSDDHSDMPLHYSCSAPHSPHSDEDSSSTMRDGGGEFSSASSAASSTASALELTNSPALLPRCGIYSEYIRDLRTVCPTCSASGRLKSKKKPLVDSLLLLAFFGDGIKKTPNGLGYIIEDSNIARELMNIISSHIRPPSRGTNNSYDNWKRAMGKTFRKSGTYFTPKDEETSKYARHVEEHLLRIFERKKSLTELSELAGDLP